MNKINWTVRFKNKVFWITLIPALLLFIQSALAIINVNVDLAILGDKLLTAVNALFVVFAICGIVVDPTTSTIYDSSAAMEYTSPKKDDVAE